MRIKWSCSELVERDGVFHYTVHNNSKFDGSAIKCRAKGKKKDIEEGIKTTLKRMNGGK